MTNNKDIKISSEQKEIFTELKGHMAIPRRIFFLLAASFTT